MARLTKVAAASIQKMPRHDVTAITPDPASGASMGETEITLNQDIVIDEDTTLKEFQKAEVMIAPSLQTEGKSLQRSQGIGMGR